MHLDVALPLVLAASVLVVFSALYAHWMVGRLRERRRHKRKEID